MSVPLLLLLLASGAPLVDDRIVRAETMASDLDLEESRGLLLEVIADPQVSDAQLLRAHLLAGEVDRILGRDVDARMHFFWVLSRDPRARLPEGRPPKVTTFFELVRAEVLASRRNEEPAAPGPPPSPAVQSTESRDGRGSSIVPAIVSIGAGAVAAMAVIPAALAEVRFASPELRIDERESTRALGVIAWSVVGVSSVAAAAAGAWWVLGE